MLKRKQTKTTVSEDNPYGLSVGDLMAGLLLIFILILSSVMLQLKLEHEKIIADDKPELEFIRKQRKIKKEIIDRLRNELSKYNVEIDLQTGVIRVKESVLFDVGDDRLKEKSGKNFLRGFIPNYSRALLAKKDIREHLAQIIIEGHTDNVWETDPEHAYEKNLELSLKRAYNVADYIFSDEFGTTFPFKDDFKQILSANGRSFVEPVAKTGEIEREKRKIKDNHPDWMEAEILQAIILAHNDTREERERNRRVEFKFRLKDWDLFEALRKQFEEGGNP